jgi:hypothetical protein
MAIGFNIQFRINEKTQSRVIRLTDSSTGFVLTKGNFSIVFPDGTTINHTDFQSPDITQPLQSYDYQAQTDIYGNVLTGAYSITFVAFDNAGTPASTTITRPFDFNWVKPVTSIVNKSDVFIPEVQFFDATSYSAQGGFTGTVARVFSTPFPSGSEVSGQPATSTPTNTLTPVYAGKYYEGLYTVSLDVDVPYAHSSNWLSLSYIDLHTKQYDIRQVPTQTNLVIKLNAFRANVDSYKEKNDTQFEIMTENYDIAIALYSHLIARYQTSTLDGSQPLYEELLSILEPYNVAGGYKATQLTPFTLGISENSYFTLSDGTNTDNFPLQSTLLFNTGNAAFAILVSDNAITFTPNFGTTNGTFASGGDSRFHNAVTLGTANGLSLSTQALSLSLATSGSSGAMSASDKAKLDGIATGATANAGTVTSIALTVPSAFSITGSPVTTSGTLAIAATGTSAQYITGAGALATLNTTNVTEGSGLYFTDSRARSAISLTTTGTSGAATYSSSTGVLNIPQYQGGVTSFNTRTGGVVLSLTDVTTALGYTPENVANKGLANGYASLDGSGLVPAAQLPSYVDDVLEYANLAGFPVTGTTGKIYVALDTNKIYRWSGSVYIEVSVDAGAIWGGITGTLSNQTDLQNALNTKEPTITAGTTSQYWRGDKSFQDFTTSARAAFTAGSGITITAGVIASTAGGGSVTSVGLSMPSAFTVTNSPVTTTGTLTVTGAGNTTQYIAGDGSLITFPIAGQAGTLVRIVRNQTGATLTKGTVIYISGATGNNPIVSKALATGDITSAQTFGLLQADIANNADGYAIMTGRLETLDTSAFTVGQQLYLSSTVAGTYTATKQYAPAHLVYIGIIIRSHPTLGEIEVKIQNGYELGELHNVAAINGSSNNNDGLFWETSTQLWKNKSIATVLGYTPLQNNQSITLSGAVTGTGATAITTTLANSIVGIANLSATGTPSSTTYLRGDNTWATVSGGAGTVTSVSVASANGFAGTVATATSTPAITISTSITGILKGNGTAISAASAGTDYQAPITLTVTGSSGASTFATNTLNIPTYTLSGLGGQALSTNLTSLSGLSYVSASFVKMTAAGTFTLDTSTYYLASNPNSYTANLGTVTSVAALTLGTSGTDLSSTVATGTTTPVITLNVPTASATNRGALSSADWSTFNGKQGAITLTTTGSSGAATLVGNTLNIPQYTGGGGGTVTSVSVTTANGISGTVATATSTPAITLTLGAITPTTVNALTLVAAATGFTIAGGTTSKTLTVFNTLTLAGTDTSTLNIGGGGTLGSAAFTASTAYQASNTNLTSLAGLTFASTAFVKMTAAGTFALDTTAYTANLGTVTSVAALTLGTSGTDVSSTVANGTTSAVITLNIPTASATNRGALSSTDWSAFNGKQGALTLTVTGSTGAATLVGNTLNIPQYVGGVSSFNTRTGVITLTSTDVTTALAFTPVPNGRTLTINGVTFDLTADRSWSVAGGSVGTISRAVQNFTATASQTTFTISGGYTAGYIDVFLNGVRLTAVDYTATNGTTVVMAAALLVGDIVDVMVYNGIALSGTAPIVYNSTTGAISITQATTSTNGYVSSTDWNTFNSKQAALGYTPLNSANPTYTGVLSTGTLSYSPAGHLFTLQTSANTYSQTIIQNSNSGSTASADIVVNNDLSTDTTYYGDYGINSSGFSGTGSLGAPNNVYLTATTSDLAIGTTTVNPIHFVVGGSATDAMTISTASQLKLPAYTATSSFSGTAVGLLGFDSSGNIITLAVGGSGTVTSASVVSANGFAGTVATATSTPAITISTSITGLLKGNGTAISAATAGTDYQAALTGTGFVKSTAGTISYDTNTYLTANQSITLSGAVTGTGATAITTTLASSIVGISNLSATGTPSATTYLRGDNTWATVSGSGFNGTLAAGTATVAPLDYTIAGSVLKTTPLAGDFEADTNGISYYSHADSSRGIMDVEQFINLSGTYTLTSQTAAQKLFNTTTNGALTVKAATTYYFECFYTLSSMSGTSGSFGFAIGGTATLTSIGWNSQSLKATTQTTAATLQTTYNTTAANTTIVSASTQTGGFTKISGYIRVNVAGTIIPQVSLGIAAAAIVGANSYFRIIPIGTNAVTSVGNWS